MGLKVTDLFLRARRNISFFFFFFFYFLKDADLRPLCFSIGFYWKLYISNSVIQAKDVRLISVG